MLFRIPAPLLAAVVGVAGVLGFEPVGFFPVTICALALLAALWRRAGSAGRAAWIGFSFGIGYFVAGISWIYVSLHDFGAMAAPLAAFLTFALAAVLAAYPAIIGFVYHRAGAHTMTSTVILLPALWTLADWIRGWLFTGFPWLAVGYSQVPLSPLAGYVPVLGVYGTTYLAALSASLLTAVIDSAGTRRVQSSIAIIVIWAAGFLLQQVAWTQPVGAPVSVSLLQGNIAQDMKWRPDLVAPTLETYEKLVTESRARLIVLPETALPLFLHEVPPDYLEALASHARGNGGDVLIGMPEFTDSEYYNSVLSFGLAPTQRYRKSHLVPFGEYIPWKLLFGWFFDVVQIPLLDFGRGDVDQAPLNVAGQKVAVDICYEDVFGAEIIRQLPAATLLVNVSNVAWFGRSVAPRQHLQISQTRALETGRYMLRATNTGMTAIVDERGHVLKEAPEFAQTTVSGEVQGFAGATPFVRWGNLPIIAFACLLAAGGVWLGRRGHSKIRGSTNA